MSNYKLRTFRWQGKDGKQYKAVYNNYWDSFNFCELDGVDWFICDPAMDDIIKAMKMLMMGVPVEEK